jgi:hypothetical protein
MAGSILDGTIKTEVQPAGGVHAWLCLILLVGIIPSAEAWTTSYSPPPPDPGLCDVVIQVMEGNQTVFPGPPPVLREVSCAKTRQDIHLQFDGRHVSWVDRQVQHVVDVESGAEVFQNATGEWKLARGHLVAPSASGTNGGSAAFVADLGNDTVHRIPAPPGTQFILQEGRFSGREYPWNGILVAVSDWSDADVWRHDARVWLYDAPTRGWLLSNASIAATDYDSGPNVNAWATTQDWMPVEFMDRNLTIGSGGGYVTHLFNVANATLGPPFLANPFPHWTQTTDTETTAIDNIVGDCAYTTIHQHIRGFAGGSPAQDYYRDGVLGIDSATGGLVKPKEYEPWHDCPEKSWAIVVGPRSATTEANPVSKGLPINSTSSPEATNEAGPHSLGAAPAAIFCAILISAVVRRRL